MYLMTAVCSVRSLPDLFPGPLRLASTLLFFFWFAEKNVRWITGGWWPNGTKEAARLDRAAPKSQPSRTFPTDFREGLS